MENEDIITEDEKLDEKSKQAPKAWWETIPPPFLYLGIGGIVLVLYNINNNSGNSSTFIWLILGVMLAVMFLGKKYKPEEYILSPRDAELHVMREIERKKKWGQFEEGSNVRLIPYVNPFHKDGGGMYYLVGAVVENIYMGSREFFQGKVMMKGPEKGYTTLQKIDTSLTGTEKQNEVSHLPEWVRKGNDNSLLGDIYKKNL